MVQSELFLLFDGLFHEIVIALLAGVGAEFHLVVDFCVVRHHLLHLGKGVIKFTLLLREGIGEFGDCRL